MTLPPLGGRRVDATRLGIDRADARFLGAVCLYSGLFLPGQLAHAAGVSARTARRHLDRIESSGAIRPVEVAGLSEPAWHAHHAGLYRDIGLPDIRFRKRASGAETLRRLLAFDYVLERPGEAWAATAADKAAAAEGLVDPASLPRHVYLGSGGAATERLFAPVKQPLAVDRAAGTALFVFGDAGGAGGKALETWGGHHAALWLGLQEAGLEVRVVAAASSEARRRELAAAGKRLRVAIRDETDMVDTPEIAELREAIRTCNWEPWGGVNQALQELGRLVLIELDPAPVESEGWLSPRVSLSLAGGAPPRVAVGAARVAARRRQGARRASQDRLAKEMIAEGALGTGAMAGELGMHRTTFRRRYADLLEAAQERRTGPRAGTEHGSDDRLAREMIEAGTMSAAAMAKQLGMHRATFYRRYGHLLGAAGSRARAAGKVSHEGRD